MYPPSLLAGNSLLLATLVAVGAGGAQEARAADPAPRVHKLTIYNGAVPTVSYYVQGGSPHQQALYRTLQFTENELTLAEEDQRLRLEAVAGATAPPWQRFGLRPVFACPSYGCDPYSTPTDNALQLIGLWEGIQTELAEARKPAAPRDRKALQDPAEAVQKAMTVLLQARAAAVPGAPAAQGPAFSPVGTRLAVRPRRPLHPTPTRRSRGEG